MDNKVEIIKCCYSDKIRCEKIFKIRKIVFVDEQMVSRDEEFDEFESNSIHYLGILDGIPVATARWRITDLGIKLERFAVLEKYRNKKVGAQILQQVIFDVTPIGMPIYLNAQVSAINFYERAGFIKEGPLFVEANIDHYKMILKH